MNILKIFLKVFLAGIVAMAILCVLFLPYVFTPVHKANPNGSTDYIWPGNALWFKMTEGISKGKFDANGFNNPTVIENPDILILGSSHMEATDVPQGQNAACLLDQMLPDHSVYNLGISSHHFLKVCKYLPTTLALYPESPEYIIIETSNVRFSQEDVDSLLQGTVDFTPSHATGVVSTLQKFPFLRLLYLQGSDLLDVLMPETSDPASVQTPTYNDAAYDALFTYIREATADHGAKIIIVYHPSGTVQPDGSASFAEPDHYKDLFAQKCAQSGIVFVDMAQPFADLYEKEHKLPHGFITGQIGIGHLNADGHRAIAQMLAQTITRLEEDAPCK